MSNAIVILLYEPSYLPGALVLGISLLKLVSSSSLDIELAVLIDETKFTDYQKHLLLQLYDTLIPVNPLTSTLTHKLTYDLQRPELASTFTKIFLWGLNQYKKVLYLDVDTLPEWESNHTILDLFKLEFPQNKILAVPDSGFPDIFNSGVFLLQPNPTDFENLQNLVIESQLNPNVSFDGADQGLLNQYFNSQPNWVIDALENKQLKSNDVLEVAKFQSSNWIKLPFFYNVVPSSQYEYLPAFKHFTQGTLPQSNPKIDDRLDTRFETSSEFKNDEIKNSTNMTIGNYKYAASSWFKEKNQIKLVHFIGPIKPWHSEGQYMNESHLHKKWWDLWNEYYGASQSIETVVFWETTLDKKLNELKLNAKKDTNPPKVNDEIVPNNSESDPQNLCDPASYQDIESTIFSNEDSAWDASKEPPPTSKPNTIKHDFMENMDNFENSWNEDNWGKSEDQCESDLKQGDKIIVEENSNVDQGLDSYPETKLHEPDVEGNSQLSSKDCTKNTIEGQMDQKQLDYSEDMDYLENKWNDSVWSKTENQIKPESRQPEEVNDVDTELVDNTNESGISEDLEKNDDVQEQEIEDDTQSLNQEDYGLAKIFPWEYRERIAPERVFEF